MGHWKALDRAAVIMEGVSIEKQLKLSTHLYRSLVGISDPQNTVSYIQMFLK